MKKTISILLATALGVLAQAQDVKIIKTNDSTMNRIEKTEQTFERLFGTKPTTHPTDPELMNILQRYIFGEVFYTGNLDDKTREMITVTVLTTMQTLPQLAAHANAALNAGVTPIELREVVYQCAPFIGFPKTLNAIGTVNEVFKKRGITLPLPEAGTVTEGDRFEKGKAIQFPIYGENMKKALADLPEEFAEAIPQFLTETCFGDFYTREGLDTKTRELIVFCCLVTLGGTERQMASHAVGNLKVGNSKETLYSAMVQCMPYIGFPRISNAINLIREAELPNQEGTKETLSPVFPLGDKLPEMFAQYFIGQAYLAPLTKNKELNCPIANVTFEPGCRNNWHSHTGGQILVAVSGKGYYQERGKAAQLLLPGTVVEIAPDVIHWHGAAPDSAFSHLAIECNPQTNKNTWLESVDDAQYQSATTSGKPKSCQ